MDRTSKSQFKAVLSARANDGRPSDLEFLLRSHCQKIKVVKKLSGAHLMIKQDKTTLAVRAYFSHDMQELNEKENEEKVYGKDEDDHDFDDLSSFLKGFKVSIIFFILPMEEQRKQLDDLLSFFQRAQKLVQQLTRNEVGKVARVCLLSNPAKAVDLLHSFAKVLHPSTEERKQKYFAQKHKQLFLPQPTLIPPTSHADGAKHVRETIAAWADRFEFPPTEAEVLCNMTKNLQTIASADSGVLQGIPLDPRTKQCMMQFFGTGPLEQEEEPMPSQQIHLGVEDPPTSPLTIPDMMRQHQMHQMQQLQHQHQHQQGQAFANLQSQHPSQPSQRPYSTQPMQNAPMMRPQSQIHGQIHGGPLARFGFNPNPTPPTRTVAPTHSLAQFPSQGISSSVHSHSQQQQQQQQQPASHGRFGPPTRTVYQETSILTAAASIPTPHQNAHHFHPQVVSHEMQYPMSNPPGSTVTQHHNHHHQEQQSRGPSYSMEPTPHHGFQQSVPPHQGRQSSTLSYHHPSQQSVASHQQHHHAMHHPSHMTPSVNPQMMMSPSYYYSHHQQQQQQQPVTTSTPRMMARRTMPSSHRNHPQPAFPPRRQRRFVP
ncbi:unnamed protein product [Cylindrotheca closterium]|uniref:Uncharacterized protein n=1 Tax=Cylindrotheca closterium TaxID=2856 RepID=A0AAD2G7F6_9STRA|nr:unnamed protein product [Cylindrotheca closterium]